MVQKNSKSGKTATAGKVGLGLLAATAGAAAGYYFYASKDAKKNRKIASKWAVAMKSEVMKTAKKVKNLDRKNLEQIVSNTAKTLSSMKNHDRKEVERAAHELKANWQIVMKELGHNSTVKSAKKVVKSAAKKVAKLARTTVKSGGKVVAAAKAAKKA